MTSYLDVECGKAEGLSFYHLLHCTMTHIQVRDTTKFGYYKIPTHSPIVHPVLFYEPHAEFHTIGVAGVPWLCIDSHSVRILNVTLIERCFPSSVRRRICSEV